MANNDWVVLDTRSEQGRVIGIVHQQFALSAELDAFPWNLKLAIRFLNLKANGMPTREENKATSNEEDALTKLLEATGHVRYFGRRTEREGRETTYRVSDPAVAKQIVEQFIAATQCQRICNYYLTPDPERHDLEWYFGLLDARANVNRKAPAKPKPIKH